MKLKNLMKKPAFLISAAFAIAAIGTGCSVFYPYIGNTYNYSVEGGSRVTYNFGATYANYTATTSTYVLGCKTTSSTTYTSGTAAGTAAGTTSSKTSMSFTDKTFTQTTTLYLDTTCSTPADQGAANPSVDETTFTYLNKNTESKKLRTTKNVAPTATSPVTVTETIGKDPVPVTEMEITQSAHTIKCSTAACATSQAATYNAMMDNSVVPAVVIASCKSLTFAAGASTDVTTCEKDNATANKKIGTMSIWLDPAAAEIYYDGTNTRVYFGMIEAGQFGFADYINGDSFYAK